MRIKNLPISERPREKAIRFGIDKISNAELIAIIIGSGTKNHSALEIANKLLIESCGLDCLNNYSYLDFKNIKGINNANAIKLAACIEFAKRITNTNFENSRKLDINALIDKYFRIFHDKNNEEIAIIILNKQNYIICDRIIAIGNEESLSCSPSIILRNIIKINGAHFLILHNHPEGISEPSQADISFTVNLIKMCEQFKIKLIDHIIIAKDDYYSFFHKQRYKK